MCVYMYKYIYRYIYIIYITFELFLVWNILESSSLVPWAPVWGPGAGAQCGGVRHVVLANGWPFWHHLWLFLGGDLDILEPSQMVFWKNIGKSWKAPEIDWLRSSLLNMFDINIAILVGASWVYPHYWTKFPEDCSNWQAASMVWPGS